LLTLEYSPQRAEGSDQDGADVRKLLLSLLASSSSPLSFYSSGPATSSRTTPSALRSPRAEKAIDRALGDRSTRIATRD
jgi:hypothetical protein